MSDHCWDTFHASFHVGATFISVNTLFLEISREFLVWVSQKIYQLPWLGEEAKTAPDSPVLTSSPGPLSPLPSSKFPSATHEQSSPEDTRGQQKNIPPSPGVHMNSSSFEVKHPSRCCCELILQMEFKFYN